jgi:lipoprotein-anchoring transpeptidase ErfK/SrfK
VLSQLKYQRRSSRKRTRKGLHLFVALLVLAATAWIWWARAAPPKGLGLVRNRSQSQSRAQLAAWQLTVGKFMGATAASSQEVETGQATKRVESGQVGREAEGQISAGLPTSVQRTLEVQLALVRHGISPGSLDGLMGPQTRAALNAWCRKEGRAFGDESNSIVELRRSVSAGPLASYVIRSNDLTRLLPLGKSWLSKSQQERLDYETVLELIAEQTQAHPNLLRQLNPGIDWSNVVAGARVQIPNAEFPPASHNAAFVRISLQARTLEVFDSETNLLAHFPCSIAQRVEKRPLGQLHVAVTAPNPNYTFDPEVFPESAEARELGQKLLLPPGPNNPVGTVWIGLDRPGYGIHGTPRPEEVGRTESHGCFRLANWNAEYLLRLVSIGTPVFVEP